VSSLSVIICTHNPRGDYLRRVLEALRMQTLPPSRWQLLLVDNASTRPIDGIDGISWHPDVRILKEDNLGLTHARFRASREADADLLAFIDDDNVPAPDYLEKALELFHGHPMIGCVSGDILGEYETPPPAWFKGEYESWIAVRRIEKDRFSSFWHPRSEPCGAGMVVRRPVLLSMIRRREGIASEMILGRSGTSLLSGEDTEISHHAMEMGYLVGQVAALKMKHLIPSRRVSTEYLFQLYRNICASGLIVSANRSRLIPPLPGFRKFALEIVKAMLKPYPESRMARERIRAHFLARRLFRNFLAQGSRV